MKCYLLFSWFFSISLIGFAQEKRNPIILNSASGDSLNLGVGTAIIKISGNSTENRYSQLELIEYPQYNTPLHLHESSDEIFFVIEGTLTVHLDGKTTEVTEGSIIRIPAGSPHAQGNFTDTDVRLLITLSPAGFENFFVERAAIVKENPPGTEEYGKRMRKLGENHDIKLLAPSPF